MKIEAIRPKEVRIMGRPVKINYEDLSDDGLFGLYRNSDNEIDIHNGSKPVEEVDTVIHEIMHAVWSLMDIQNRKVEEHIVRKLATGMTQVFQDNPHLLNYIAKAAATTK